jgi:DNA invertase Pin-like site-specific DNA recombinase
LANPPACLGRTAKELCDLFDDLQNRKVDLVSVNDEFSLNTPVGWLHARILASVAECENEVRSERIRIGQAAARAKGITGGVKPLGVYFKVTPDQEKMIIKMVAKREKTARVARITGLSRPTIYRVPRNQESPK